MLHCFLFQWMLILTLSSQIRGYQRTNQIEISAGHVFSLECNPSHEEEEMEVRWISEENHTLDSHSGGIEVINQTLWFLPAELSHTGNYSCAFWYNNRSERAKKNFFIAVTNSTFPPVKLSLERGNYNLLSCNSGQISKILQLDPDSHVTWIKDGRPLGGNDLHLFLKVEENTVGEYTCLVNFTYNGKIYSEAKTFQVSTCPGFVPQKPKVVKPQQERLAVKVGSRVELNCKVFVGTDKIDPAEPNNPHWLVNNKYPNDFPELSHSDVLCTAENSTIYCQRNLTIFQVQKKFLGIPFRCHIRNSKGSDNGTVTLYPDSQSEIYYGLAVLVVYVMVALGLLVFRLFKVDLVLAYRKLHPCSKRLNDGKLYDAYVSFFHGNDQSVSFALRLLPEVLEDQLGYKLFISGRDEPLGAAVHDVIAETIRKCRRLIIILSSQTSTTHTHCATVGLMHEMPAGNLSLNNNETALYPHMSDSAGTNGLNWGPYELWVGLYDALVKGGLQVILVQVGGEVDEAQLPESLRYIMRTQGKLYWKQDYTTKPNGRFWKLLRYAMPPVQKVKMSAVV